MSRAFELIMELSKTTLADYISAATTSAIRHAHHAGSYRARPSGQKRGDVHAIKANKRATGIDLAANKLAGIPSVKEEVLNELSKKTLANYIHQATTQAISHAHTAGQLRASRTQAGTSAGNQSAVKANKRATGIDLAADKLAGKPGKEKAYYHIRNDDAAGKRDAWAVYPNEHGSMVHSTHATERAARQMASRLNKNAYKEIEEEVLDELSKDTLDTYAKKASRGLFVHGYLAGQARTPIGSQHELNKAHKRASGISRAFTRLTSDPSVHKQVKNDAKDAIAHAYTAGSITSRYPGRARVEMSLAGRHESNVYATVGNVTGNHYAPSEKAARAKANEETITETNASHGSPYDRGSADAYYGRAKRPHKGGVGGGSGPRVESLTREEERHYHKGYDDAVKAGNFNAKFRDIREETIAEARNWEGAIVVINKPGHPFHGQPGVVTHHVGSKTVSVNAYDKEGKLHPQIGYFHHNQLKRAADVLANEETITEASTIYPGGEVVKHKKTGRRIGEVYPSGKGPRGQEYGYHSDKADFGADSFDTKKAAIAACHQHHAELAKEEVITETLSKSATAKDYINDFVHSKNKMFKGDSTKQRIRRALGAYYHSKGK